MLIPRPPLLPVRVAPGVDSPARPRLRPHATELGAFFLAMLVLGALSSGLWRSFEGRPTYATRYSLQLTDAVGEMAKEQEQLKAQLAELRAELDGVHQRSAGISGEAAELKRQIDAVGAEAGLVPLQGPGITVMLDDAKLPAHVKDIARAIVHSQDLTDVISTAWKGGAEAIAINGERITGTSACVGAVIQINGALMSPPYVVSIIGPTQRLLGTFEATEELGELKERSRLYGLGLAVESAAQLRVPAFTGPLTARYAQLR